MKAELIHKRKLEFPDGAILEMVIWRVPRPVKGSAHAFKYRLFYGRAGQRIVGYDNERPKGDHRHLDGVETAYAFTNVDQLISDFLADVTKRRTP